VTNNIWEATMSKISSEDCKKAIVDWITANPSYFGHRSPAPTVKDLKRISKTKTYAKLILRKFHITAYYAYDYSCDDLYVLENADGTLTVLTDDPDRKWGFSIEIQEEPGVFSDRVVWFYTADISSSILLFA
jgi:hypothetical protein